jgi:sterol desaturase/sphingolipid hydroxylase (fatty acid hydroxylase superfamily)
MINDQFEQILFRMKEFFASQFLVVAALAIFFTLLSIFQSQASSRGKTWWKNPGLVSDICHALVNSVLAPYLRVACLTLMVFFVAGKGSPDAVSDYFKIGRGLFQGLPFWWQAAIYLVFGDLLLYWIHRAFHGRRFWKFHAIHHSATQVDWTTAYRNHPVNFMLQQSFAGAAMLVLGISLEVVAFFIPWEVFSAAFVHANLKWSFGPLKYVIATPVFHRWHHGLPDDGGNSNFAPTFAFWDVLFGTFYMPAGRLPLEFGVDDPNFPENYLLQFSYPFKLQAGNEEAPQQGGFDPGDRAAGRTG